MAKYGVNYYGASKYGAYTKLAYSVDPMSTLVLDFSRIQVSWQSPRGTFTQVRLVRSQTGFPETAEDGVIVFDEYASEGTVSRSFIIDGETNPEDIPLVPGRQVYYRFFLFTSEKLWRVAGSITAILPSNHQVLSKFIRTIPRVFTSKEQSPLGEVDETSALYSFSDGLTFNHEILYTLLDLLRPRYAGLETPVELLVLEATNVGLTPEPGLPTKNQKRLIREALYMYSHKGTQSALETYVESLTGFAPTITVSPNLLLSVQDSTFYDSVGNWTATNATISSSTDLVPASGTNVIDGVYTCKIEATDAGYIILGNDDVVTKGVPVTASTEYTFSCQLKSPTSAGDITLSVTFYDKDGNTTSSANSSSAVSANNTWKSASVTATTDADSSYAVIQIDYSASGTYYVDQVCAQLGDTVDYYEARAVDIFVNPTRSNFINNPSFEDNVTDSWTLDGSAIISQDTDIPANVYTGTSSALIDADGSWSLTSNNVPVIEGPYYTFSVYLKSTDGITITFIGKDSNGDATGHTDVYTVAAQPEWSRVSATDLIEVQDELNVVSYDIVISGGAGTFYLDCAQFERGQIASDYFDGSLPSDFGAVWEGTANNSPTHLYYNKPSKIPRLGLTVNDWVPPNTFWRVISYAGVEYTNLTV